MDSINDNDLQLIDNINLHVEYSKILLCEIKKEAFEDYTLKEEEKIQTKNLINNIRLQIVTQSHNLSTIFHTFESENSYLRELYNSSIDDLNQLHERSKEKEDNLILKYNKCKDLLKEQVQKQIALHNQFQQFQPIVQPVLPHISSNSENLYAIEPFLIALWQITSNLDNIDSLLSTTTAFVSEIFKILEDFINAEQLNIYNKKVPPNPNLFLPCIGIIVNLSSASRGIKTFQNQTTNGIKVLPILISLIPLKISSSKENRKLLLDIFFNFSTEKQISKILLKEGILKHLRLIASKEKEISILEYILSIIKKLELQKNQDKTFPIKFIIPPTSPTS